MAGVNPTDQGSFCSHKIVATVSKSLLVLAFPRSALGLFQGFMTHCFMSFCKGKSMMFRVYNYMIFMAGEKLCLLLVFGKGDACSTVPVSKNKSGNCRENEGSFASSGLNNLLQPKRSSEEAAAKLHEALQAASKDHVAIISEVFKLCDFRISCDRMAFCQDEQNEQKENGTTDDMNKNSVRSPFMVTIL